YADKIGKRIPRRKISDYLLSEFIDWRNKLLNNLKKGYPTYSEEERDEIVQTLLDRLIFIRNCEDRGYEEKRLDASLREFIFNEKSINKSFKEIFRYYDENYDSKIFEFREIDKVDFEEGILKNIIERLYKTKDENIAYDFSLIDADILGNLYEQYLSHISKKSTEKNKAKRKSQGIYYTPTYVVDYIVKSTLSGLLGDKKVKKDSIKVLDIACGSGSFLIKAFDYLVALNKQKGEIEQTKLDLSGVSTTYDKKVEILKKNIFGVDLDTKAVEIAQLNLLLKMAEKKHRLPTLKENIKVGNSLFEEVKFANDNAFDWDSEFREIMRNGGFDVIIGNPPYVDIKGMPPKQVDGLFEKYKTSENRINLYSIFVERAIQLLKNGGYFGFIMPNSILFNSSYNKIRKLLLDKVDLIEIVRMPDNVFEDAKVETIILIFKKKDSSKSKKTNILIYDKDDKITEISSQTAKQRLTVHQEEWEKNADFVFSIFADKETNSLLNKLEENSMPLIELADFSLGITPYDKYRGHTKKQIENKEFHSNRKEDENYKKLISGGDIVRYGIFWNGKNWIKYGSWLGAPRDKRFFTEPHIVVRQIVSGKPLRIYAGYTEEELINAQIGFNIITKDENKAKIKYLLALLNSRLINFYHTEKYLDKSKNLFQKILIQNAKKFPIKIPDCQIQEEVCSRVNKILELTKSLNELGEKLTDERNRLEEQINKTDEDIDKMIYKIYGITKEEQEIIEKS
ncbi:MAG TPA: N-6 DNA methylase, partial [Candidatus Nanoarchaeia archaeon]|nr:N-6 DNA methylase [Candidatus Nanoarchaeia archaeon]